MKKLFTALVIVSFFSGCQQHTWKEGEKEIYIDKGKIIAQATAKSMLAEVGKNMKEGGVVQAAPYCHAHASELTKQMAEENGVTIKRTSHKLRNLENAPNDEEQKILDDYLALIADKMALTPVVEKDKQGNVHFYAPIMLQQKCTVCHGVKGETLKEEHYEIIKTLYPDDQAIGFADGDFRGIWHITFDKE